MRLGLDLILVYSFHFDNTSIGRPLRQQSPVGIVRDRNSNYWTMMSVYWRTAIVYWRMMMMILLVVSMMGGVPVDTVVVVAARPVEVVGTHRS